MIYIVQPEKVFDNPVDQKQYKEGDEVAIARVLAKGAVDAGVLVLKPAKKSVRRRIAADDES